MAETDILNPVAHWLNEIQDNPCPDYGFERSRADLRARVKAPGGMPDSREVQNSGHTFSLSWLNRSYLCVQRVLQFAAQHEDGYFTIIDRDAGRNGRHYVGRFEGEVKAIQNGNDSYDLRDLRFVEFPGAPMLQYPNDWDRDSIVLGAQTPWGKQLPATRGAWTGGLFVGEAKTLLTLDNAGTPNDSVSMDYRGYGFKLSMQSGRGYGQVQVFVDGLLMQPRNEDSSLGSPVIDLYADADNAPKDVFLADNLSIDLHRVKVVVQGTKNSASSGTAVSYVSLRVMR